jgi:hypothetical protein
VKPVLDVRRQTFGRQSMLLALSPPRPGHRPRPGEGLDRRDHGDLRRQHPLHLVVAVPALRSLVVAQPERLPGDDLDYPDDPDVPLDVVEREAHLLCPVNGCVSRTITARR